MPSACLGMFSFFCFQKHIFRDDHFFFFWLSFNEEFIHNCKNKKQFFKTKKIVWMLMVPNQHNIWQLPNNPRLPISSTTFVPPHPNPLDSSNISSQPNYMKPPSTTNLNLIKPTHHLFIKHKNPIKGPILTPTTKAKRQKQRKAGQKRGNTKQRIE